MVLVFPLAEMDWGRRTVAGFSDLLDSNPRISDLGAFVPKSLQI